MQNWDNTWLLYGQKHKAKVTIKKTEQPLALIWFKIKITKRDLNSFEYDQSAFMMINIFVKNTMRDTN